MGERVKRLKVPFRNYISQCFHCSGMLEAMPTIKDRAAQIDSGKAVPQFAEDCIVRSGARVESTFMYRTFHAWVKACGIDYVCSHNEFSRRLQELGYAKKKSGRMWWIGVSVVPWD